jgi:tetratricopeptide (TPR) repeat protein
MAVCAGLALLFAGALLAPIARALPTIFHEISEALPTGLPSGIQRIYPIAILSAPVILLRPWAWATGFFWFVILFLFLVRRQLTRADKAFAIIAVLWMAALPSIAVFLGTLAAAHTPRSPAFSLARSRDPFLRDYVGDALRTAYSVGADDPAIIFELALHERRHGSVQEAADLYERLLDDGRNRTAAAGAHVNLGNILYARGEVREAAQRYEQALALTPNSAAAHYNLGVALSDAFDFGSSKTHFRSASALNFDFVRSLSRASDDGDNVIVVDEATPARDRWRWLFANQEVVRQIDAPSTARALQAILLPAMGAGMVLLVLLFAAAFVAGRLDTRAEPCAACGRPVCRKCRARISRRSFCSGCSLVVGGRGSVGVIADEKARRFRAAHAFDRIVSLVLAIFVPGAGHVYAGKRVLGCVILFVSGAALFLLATAGGPLRPVPVLDAELFAAARPRLVLVLVTLHIAFLIHFFALARRKFD